MKLWPLVRENGWLKDILKDDSSVKFWTQIFQNTYDGKINSWAYRWNFSCWIQNYLSILSNVNLISNIGYGNVGTNTKKSLSVYSNLPTKKLELPLQHPPFVIQDTKADKFTQTTLYKRNLIAKIRFKIKAYLQNQNNHV